MKIQINVFVSLRLNNMFKMLNISCVIYFQTQNVLFNKQHNYFIYNMFNARVQYVQTLQQGFCSVGSLHSKDKLKVYLERYRIFCIMKSLINSRNKLLSNIHIFNECFELSKFSEICILIVIYIKLQHLPTYALDLSYLCMPADATHT